MHACNHTKLYREREDRKALLQYKADWYVEGKKTTKEKEARYPRQKHTQREG